MNRFKDIRVRKAISMAIDREAFVDAIQGGAGVIFNAEIHAEMPENYFTPFEKLPRSIQENWESNPERARQLLAEAGYPNGFETTIQAYSKETERDVVSFLAAMWKDIGIDVKIDLRDSTTLDGILTQNEHAPLTFLRNCLCLPGHTLMAFGVDEAQVYQVNVVDDPEINEVYEQWGQAQDPAEAAKIMKGLNVLWLSKVYTAYAPTPRVNIAYWPWVENYAGEVNVGCCFMVGGIFARAWINRDFKGKITVMSQSGNGAISFPDYDRVEKQGDTKCRPT